MHPSRRKPNCDASGSSLDGQAVNYNLSTGDYFTMYGNIYRVTDSYPNGARTETLRTGGGVHNDAFTYEQMKADGAVFTALRFNQLDLEGIAARLSESFNNVNTPAAIADDTLDRIKGSMTTTQISVNGCPVAVHVFTTDSKTKQSKGTAVWVRCFSVQQAFYAF